LVLEVLRYADEVTKAQTYFRGLPADTTDEDMLDLATSIIDKRTAPFKPEEFHDRYVDALHRLIDKKKKAKGKRIIEDVDDEPTGRKGGNVIDLMAALKKSAGEGGRKTASTTKTSAKKAAPRKTAPKRKSA
jgi:DNA end-binding protein Ku